MGWPSAGSSARTASRRGRPASRPAGPGGDDQKRTVDVRQAFANGADYIVVGRPIRKADDPREQAERIQTQIATAT